MAGRRLLVSVLVAVLVASAAAPSVAGSAPATQPDVDNTVTRIEVAADGTATWTVSVRTRLETDTQVEEFRAYQERFRNNTTQYVATFRDRIELVVARAANETGREMRATNFSASTSIQELPRRWGVVTYEFTWTGFAAQRGDTLAVGDVFQGGFYLAADDSLVISPPSGYDIADVSPEPDARENETVRWTGPLDFADQRPAVRYEEAAAATTTETTTAPPSGDAGGIPWMPIAAVVLLVLLVAAAVAYRARADESAATTPTEERVVGAGPMTDEERVHELLAANGGRMEQSAVAEELDWSPSKTSRVVSSMVEAESVEKLRVGRKNVLELAED